MDTVFQTISAPFSYSFTVDESHIDVFGHVNNAEYLRLFEDARWDIVSSGGFGIEFMKEMKQGPVITEVNIKYLREIRPGQEITITSTCRMATDLIFHVEQNMRDSEGVLYSEALFIGGLFDLAERRIIPPTAQWLQAMGLPRDR